MAKKDNEIVIEQHYAEKHSMNVGDTISLAGKDILYNWLGILN